MKLKKSGVWIVGSLLLIPAVFAQASSSGYLSILEFYTNNSGWVDFITYFLLFGAAARLAAEKQFGESRQTSIIALTIAFILSMSLALWQFRNGFSLASVGSLSLILLFVAIGFIYRTLYLKERDGKTAHGYGMGFLGLLALALFFLYLIYPQTILSLGGSLGFGSLTSGESFLWIVIGVLALIFLANALRSVIDKTQGSKGKDLSTLGLRFILIALAIALFWYLWSNFGLFEALAALVVLIIGYLLYYWVSGRETGEASPLAGIGSSKWLVPIILIIAALGLAYLFGGPAIAAMLGSLGVAVLYYLGALLLLFLLLYGFYKWYQNRTPSEGEGFWSKFFDKRRERKEAEPKPEKKESGKAGFFEKIFNKLNVKIHMVGGPEKKVFTYRRDTQLRLQATVEKGSGKYLCTWYSKTGPKKLPYEEEYVLPLEMLNLEKEEEKKKVKVKVIDMETGLTGKAEFDYVLRQNVPELNLQKPNSESTVDYEGPFEISYEIKNENNVPVPQWNLAVLEGRKSKEDIKKRGLKKFKIVQIDTGLDIGTTTFLAEFPDLEPGFYTVVLQGINTRSKVVGRLVDVFYLKVEINHRVSIVEPPKQDLTRIPLFTTVHFEGKAEVNKRGKMKTFGWVIYPGELATSEGIAKGQEVEFIPGLAVDHTFGEDLYTPGRYTVFFQGHSEEGDILAEERRVIELFESREEHNLQITEPSKNEQPIPIPIREEEGKRFAIEKLRFVAAIIEDDPKLIKKTPWYMYPGVAESFESIDRTQLRNLRGDGLSFSLYRLITKRYDFFKEMDLKYGKQTLFVLGLDKEENVVATDMIIVDLVKVNEPLHTLEVEAVEIEEPERGLVKRPASMTYTAEYEVIEDKKELEVPKKRFFGLLGSGKDKVSRKKYSHNACSFDTVVTIERGIGGRDNKELIDQVEKAMKLVLNLPRENGKNLIQILCEANPNLELIHIVVGERHRAQISKDMNTTKIEIPINIFLGSIPFSEAAEREISNIIGVLVDTLLMNLEKVEGATREMSSVKTRSMRRQLPEPEYPNVETAQIEGVVDVKKLERYFSLLNRMDAVAEFLKKTNTSEFAANMIYQKEDLERYVASIDVALGHIEKVREILGEIPVDDSERKQVETDLKRADKNIKNLMKSVEKFKRFEQRPTIEMFYKFLSNEKNLPEGVVINTESDVVEYVKSDRQVQRRIETFLTLLKTVYFDIKSAKDSLWLANLRSHRN